MSTIKLRLAEYKDFKALTELTCELGYETTIEQMEERMDVISKLENYWTYVAELEQQIVGYIGLVKSYSWEHDGHFLRIAALVVKKDWREKGVGKELILFSEKFAKDINARTIVLNCGTRDERKSAHLFYPKMGFEAKSIGYQKLQNYINSNN